jgi:DNA ligase-1
MERFGNRSITCEFKYDGERAQLHVLNGGRVKIFSRNSEDTTAKFPDVVAEMAKALAKGVKEVVVDCEVVAFNASSQQILPFQTLSTRARKNVVSSEIKVQVTKTGH